MDIGSLTKSWTIRRKRLLCCLAMRFHRPYYPLSYDLARDYADDPRIRVSKQRELLRAIGSKLYMSEKWIAARVISVLFEPDTDLMLTRLHGMDGYALDKAYYQAFKPWRVTIPTNADLRELGKQLYRLDCQDDDLLDVFYDALMDARCDLKRQLTTELGRGWWVLEEVLR